MYLEDLYNVIRWTSNRYPSSIIPVYMDSRRWANGRVLPISINDDNEVLVDIDKLLHNIDRLGSYEDEYGINRCIDIVSYDGEVDHSILDSYISDDDTDMYTYYLVYESHNEWVVNDLASSILGYLMRKIDESDI